MSREERPHFLDILNDIRNTSANTNPTTDINKGWSTKTQEEIIEDIRRGIHELRKRGLLMDEMAFHEHQLGVIKSLENWHSGKNKSLPDMFLIDSLPPDLIGLPVVNTNVNHKSLFHNLIPNFSAEIKDITSRHFSQYSIDELQKILQKHPNRMDVKLELMKLQRANKSKFIGRPKRKKRK